MTTGIELQTQFPFDIQGLISQLKASATINELEGFIQGMDTNLIQTAFALYQTQLQTYINNTEPNATVREVLGTQTIIPLHSSMLAASLPYQLIARGNTFAVIPDSLRHQFQYKLYASELDQLLENPICSFVESLPKLAGKKITLSFRPASQVDADLIAAYLPQPHVDGTPIHPSEFPTSLPGYLIHLTPEFRVEGEVIASGGTLTMGTDLIGEGGFTQLNFGGWDLSTTPLIAGQTSALGISVQGISHSQMEQLTVRLEDTKAKLEAKDVASLTADPISGDLLTATIWSYFASLDSFGWVAKNQDHIVDLPGLSYGFFHAVVAPNRVFGITTTVKFPGVKMDIGHLRHIRVDKNNDTQAWINYNRPEVWTHFLK